MKRFVLVVIGIVLAYLVLFMWLLSIVWPSLDPLAVVGIVGVLGGGLAGVMGSLVAGLIGLWGADKESEDRLKNYASQQALELTKLEYELRRQSRAHWMATAVGTRTLLAPANVYREFYKALFDLYATRSWPKEIEEMGLLSVLKYDVSEDSKESAASILRGDT